MAVSFFMIARPLTGNPALLNQTQDLFFRNWNATQLMSFSAADATPVSISPTGTAAGKISFADLTFTKKSDPNSPTLLRYCATGQPFDRITIYVTSVTGAGENTLEIYTFGTAFVTGISRAGTSGDDVVTESITITYGQFDHRVISYSPTGARSGTTEFAWDAIRNATWSPGTLDGPG